MKTKEQAIVAQLQAELARRELLEFARLMYPGFQPARHLELFADLIQRVARQELKRVIITVHPGSGKSVFMQLGSAWMQGLDPKMKFIVTSAGAELAERHSRATRGFITSDLWPFETRLSEDTRSMSRWNTTEGGGMFAIGTGGTITGWRANCILVDDPMNSAGSELERESLWAWFREVLTPRLEPNGAIIIVMARWCEDDLVGRILDAPDGHTWHVVELPALAEENDALGRKPGEPLWPERFGVAELERIKVAMGSRAFATQFQGNPVPLEGNLIKAEWLQRYDVAPVREQFDRVILTVDASAKTGIANDYTAIAAMGITKNDCYLLDMKRRKVEYPDLLKMVIAAQEEHNASAIYVEDTSNATALIQELKRQSHLPIVAKKPIGSKIARVEAICGMLEAGKVFIPKEAPWLLDFERELLAFPHGKHDDMVDAFEMAVSQAKKKKFAYAALISGDSTSWSTADGQGYTESVQRSAPSISGVANNVRAFVKGW